MASGVRCHCYNGLPSLMAHHINLVELNCTATFVRPSPQSQQCCLRHFGFCLQDTIAQRLLFIHVRTSYDSSTRVFLLVALSITAARLLALYSLLLNMKRTLLGTIHEANVKTESTKESKSTYSFIRWKKYTHTCSSDLNSLLVNKWHWTFGICRRGVQTE